MGEDIKGADGSHDETSGLHRTEHIVGVLPEGPFIEKQAPETGERDLMMRSQRKAGGMLHPRVGGDNKVAAHPGAEKDKEGGPPVADASEFFLAVEEETEERGLKKEGEDAFHGEGLADDAASGFGEFGPVGAELKFHGDAGDNTEGKVDAEDLGPKAGGASEVLVAGAQGNRFQDDDQEGKTHGQLREEIVKRNGECEMKTMDVQRGTQRPPLN